MPPPRLIALFALRLHTARRSRLFATYSAVVPLHVTAMPPATAAAAALDGDATPLLFVHGLLGSATNFRAIQTRAARCGRATLAVDLRDHGASPHAAAGPAASSLLDYARDVAAAIEARLGPGRAVDVVGHSLGGKTAMVLALTRPWLVRRVAVVDIAPVDYAADAAAAQAAGSSGGGGGGGGGGASSSSAWRDVAAVVAAAHALDASRFRSRQEVEAALAASVADAGVRAFVCQNLIAQPGGGYRWRMNGAALLASLPHFAAFPGRAALQLEREAAEAKAGPGASLGGPPGAAVHFLSGERSGYIRERHHERIRVLFPAAVLHAPVAGAGHWVHADKPAAFWELLSRIMSLHEKAA
jgi:esterase